MVYRRLYIAACAAGCAIGITYAIEIECFVSSLKVPLPTEKNYGRCDISHNNSLDIQIKYRKDDPIEYKSEKLLPKTLFGAFNDKMKVPDLFTPIIRKDVDIINFEKNSYHMNTEYIKFKGKTIICSTFNCVDFSNEHNIYLRTMSPEDHCERGKIIYTETAAETMSLRPLCASTSAFMDQTMKINIDRGRKLNFFVIGHKGIPLKGISNVDGYQIDMSDKIDSAKITKTVLNFRNKEKITVTDYYQILSESIQDDSTYLGISTCPISYENIDSLVAIRTSTSMYYLSRNNEQAQLRSRDCDIKNNFVYLTLLSNTISLSEPLPEAAFYAHWVTPPNALLDGKFPGLKVAALLDLMASLDENKAINPNFVYQHSPSAFHGATFTACKKQSGNGFPSLLMNNVEGLHLLPFSSLFNTVVWSENSYTLVTNELQKLFYGRKVTKPHTESLSEISFLSDIDNQSNVGTTTSIEVVDTDGQVKLILNWIKEEEKKRRTMLILAGIEHEARTLEQNVRDIVLQKINQSRDLEITELTQQIHTTIVDGMEIWNEEKIRERVVERLNRESKLYNDFIQQLREQRDAEINDIMSQSQTLSVSSAAEVSGGLIPEDHKEEKNKNNAMIREMQQSNADIISTAHEKFLRQCELIHTKKTLAYERRAKQMLKFLDLLRNKMDINVGTIIEEANNCLKDQDMNSPKSICNLGSPATKFINFYNVSAQLKRLSEEIEAILKNNKTFTVKTSRRERAQFNLANSQLSSDNGWFPRRRLTTSNNNLLINRILAFVNQLRIGLERTLNKVNFIDEYMLQASKDGTTSRLSEHSKAYFGQLVVVDRMLTQLLSNEQNTEVQDEHDNANKEEELLNNWKQLETEDTFITLDKFESNPIENQLRNSRDLDIDIPDTGFVDSISFPNNTSEDALNWLREHTKLIQSKYVLLLRNYHRLIAVKSVLQAKASQLRTLESTLNIARIDLDRRQELFPLHGNNPESLVETLNPRGEETHSLAKKQGDEEGALEQKDQKNISTNDALEEGILEEAVKQNSNSYGPLLQGLIENNEDSSKTILNLSQDGTELNACKLEVVQYIKALEGLQTELDNVNENISKISSELVNAKENNSKISSELKDLKEENNKIKSELEFEKKKNEGPTNPEYYKRINKILKLLISLCVAIILMFLFIIIYAFKWHKRQPPSDAP